MTAPRAHIFRLLKWGRTLAKHGALRGIENDPNTPPPVKRLARIARFGTVQPRVAGEARAVDRLAVVLDEVLQIRHEQIRLELEEELARLLVLPKLAERSGFLHEG